MIKGPNFQTGGGPFWSLSIREKLVYKKRVFICMYKWRFPFRLGSIFIVVAAKVPYIYYHEELEDARLSLGYRIIL